jgi:hypothetical protein
MTGARRGNKAASGRLQIAVTFQATLERWDQSRYLRCVMFVRRMRGRQVRRQRLLDVSRDVLK